MQAFPDCRTCGTALTGPKCYVCHREYINRIYEFFDTVGRSRASGDYGFKKYPDYCDIHGVQDFHLVSKTCCLCDIPGGGDYLRIIARRDGEKMYAKTCSACGPSDAWTTNGKCARCYNAGGVRRPKRRYNLIRDWTNPARIAARAAGVKTFEGYCPDHDETPFWVACGKCCECNLEDGSIRETEIRRPHNPLRIAARQARHKQYFDPQYAVGHRDRWVQGGTCTECTSPNGRMKANVEFNCRRFEK